MNKNWVEEATFDICGQQENANVIKELNVGYKRASCSKASIGTPQEQTKQRWMNLVAIQDVSVKVCFAKVMIDIELAVFSGLSSFYSVAHEHTTTQLYKKPMFL